MNDNNIIVAEAKKWIGYLEHKDERLLGIYRANIGKGGYTIFSTMIYETQGRNMQSFPWCATFVHAIFNRPDILGKAHPGTRVLQRRMKRKKLWRSTNYIPVPGDLIFCSNHATSRVEHVGIVTKYENGIVYSIDGNTVDPTGQFPAEQGGAVAERERKHEDAKIVGYAATGNLITEKGVEG